MPKKSVTVHYRRFEDVGERLKGSDLEKACRTAFNTSISGKPITQRIGHRIWTRTPAPGDNLLVNVYHDDGASLFGDITAYTEGELKALLDAGKLDGPSVPVKQIPPPEGNEYVTSIMYWLIVGNHVLVIQSQSLRTGDLEQYFTWLLSEKASTIAKPFHVILSSKFDPAAVGGDLEDITEITVGGVLLPPATPELEAAPEIVEVTQTGKVSAARRAPFSRAKEVLVALFGAEARADEYLEAVPPEAELQLEVHIGYKSRKRKLDRRPLKALEAGLRNLGDGDIRVAAKGGRKTPEGDIRLHETVLVEQVGSLIDPSDCRERMHAVLKGLVEKGKIEL